MPTRLTPPPRIFLTTDAVGGVWTHAVTLAHGLTARGAEVTVAVLGPGPSPAQAAAVNGCRLMETGLPLDWAGADAPALRDAGQRLASMAAAAGADLVHLNSPALAAGGAFGVPLVIGCHSCVATWWTAVRDEPLPHDLLWQRDLSTAGYAKAGALVAPTQAFAEMSARSHNLAQPPRVVPNGLAPRPLAALSRRDGVFAAGRLWDAAKNMSLLDGLAPQLGAPITVAGPLAAPGGQPVQFQNLRHVGLLDDAGMQAQLAATGIFVSPAIYEPFGLAVLEAAQAGCALVLADIPTFREVWDDAADYAPPRDQRGFLALLRRLLDDPARRERRGADARRRAARYSQAAMADGMLALYRELLPGRLPEEAAA
jgi:glycosyltransferase involved in cell wall biosynthesis